MHAFDTSTERLPPATLRLVEGLPQASEVPEAARTSAQPRRRGVPDGWHVPFCVLLSVVAHGLLTVWMPTAAAREPAAPERDLVFLDLREVMPAAPEPPPAPEPVIVPPPPVAQDPLRPPPPRELESEPAPSAPPPAAAEVLAATSASAGAPAFTTGTASGSVHGVGSTPTASETNPAATRPSEGAGVDVRGLMRGYMATLNGRVRPSVVYPRAAVIAGLEGTVMIGLLVDAQGNILRRRVKRSSGHTSLDSAVLEAAERLATVPAPPADLRAAWTGGPQEITVPIRMTLTN